LRCKQNETHPLIIGLIGKTLDPDLEGNLALTAAGLGMTLLSARQVPALREQPGPSGA
jgi:hypothetical protein